MSAKKKSPRAAAAVPVPSPPAPPPPSREEPPPRRPWAGVALAALCLYVAAIYLLALDQQFHWGIFPP